MSSESTKNLARAVLAVMQDVDGVAKSSTNEQQRYKYASEAAFIEAIRPALIAHGLAVIPSLASRVNRSKTSSGGNALDLTIVEMDYTLIHVESGESMTIRFPGEGMDSGDKGLYKAITGANKYMLFKLFQVPTEDDPEATQQQGQTQQRQAPPPQPQGQQSHAPQSSQGGAPCNIPVGDMRTYTIKGGELKQGQRGDFYKLKLSYQGSKYEQVTIFSQSAYQAVCRVLGTSAPWNAVDREITLKVTRHDDTEWQGKMYPNLRLENEQDVLSDGGYSYEGVDPAELGPPLDMDEELPPLSPGA